jgi:hypothetical protein
MYGITGNINRWLKSFLVGRRQRVVLNGNYSKWTNVISGVPQGTILGPILFLIYINDIVDSVKTNIKLFADDAKIFTKINSIEDCARLQTDLNTVAAWTKRWLLGFNKEKCVVVRNRKSIPFTYHIDGHPLKEVDQQKDLGVIVSNDLKPSKHITYVCKKAQQRLGMI